jgi:hypothetical protein
MISKLKHHFHRRQDVVHVLCRCELLVRFSAAECDDGQRTDGGVLVRRMMSTALVSGRGHNALRSTRSMLQFPVVTSCLDWTVSLSIFHGHIQRQHAFANERGPAIYYRDADALFTRRSTCLKRLFNLICTPYFDEQELDLKYLVLQPGRARAVVLVL